MAFKVMLFFFLASFLVLSTKVSSDEEALIATVPVKAPTIPVKAPTVPVKAPTVPIKAPVKAPTVPVKAPTVPVKAPAAAPVKAPAPAPVLPPVSIAECPKLCGARCSKHSKRDHCLRVCGTCCQRCKCVPPGTYGNKEMCGKCYTDMTTHGGKPKCP